MGRKRKTNSNLPPRLAAIRKPNGTVYYYYDTGSSQGRFISLGKNYIEAVRRWAEFEQGNSSHNKLLTFKDAVDQYRIEVIPTKAPRTQSDNEAELAKLLEFFGDARLDQIQPLHVKQYRNWRTAKVRANREIALLSHIWNMAREWGATDKPNPCAGIKRNKEGGRDIYITDEELSAILKHADPVLQDAVELAYLTGQRPADVLKLRETDIREGCLEFRQGKTNTPLRISINATLLAVLERCKARKRGTIYSTAIITGTHGKPISVQWLSILWSRARDAAGIERGIQFRDLRAKAVSDKEDSTDIRTAQALAGHSTVTMTEHYSRKRRGAKVEPTK